MATFDGRRRDIVVSALNSQQSGEKLGETLELLGERAVLSTGKQEN